MRRARAPCWSMEALLTGSKNRYQWLNHYALFSGGYREDALECMERLVEKYGRQEEEEEESDLSGE